MLVSYMIMWVMKVSKLFGKIAILKTWELISLGGVKTYFGKVALKWCIFSNEKNIITDIVSLLLIQSGFRHTKHLKMTIWISFVKDLYVVDEKMARNGHTMSNKFYFVLLQNCKKTRSKRKYLCHSFSSNWRAKHNKQWHITTGI